MGLYLYVNKLTLQFTTVSCAVSTLMQESPLQFWRRGRLPSTRELLILNTVKSQQPFNAARLLNYLGIPCAVRSLNLTEIVCAAPVSAVSVIPY